MEERRREHKEERGGRRKRKKSWEKEKHASGEDHQDRGDLGSDGWVSGTGQGQPWATRLTIRALVPQPASGAVARPGALKSRPLFVPRSPAPWMSAAIVRSSKGPS